MVSSAKKIAAFNPDPGAVRPTPAALRGLSDEEAANALSGGHPKSQRPKHHPHMEEPRTGLPHVSPVSTRFIEAHAARGTSVNIPVKGP